MKSPKKTTRLAMWMTFQTSLILGGIIVLLMGCSGGDKPNVELLQDMMESPAIKAQEYDEQSPDHRGMRTPPEHTVPVGFKPYAFTKDYEGATKNPNPLAGDFSPEVLITGQKYYDTNCAICHGEKGDGEPKVEEGHLRVVDKLAVKKPPSLLTEKIKGWSDGQVYHVIQMGQGLMNPYASHIPKEKWRWAVVQYIRHLEKETK